MNKEITVAILTNGGAGSLFIQVNFMQYFKEYLTGEPVKLYAYGHKSMGLNDAVFYKQPFIDHYYSYADRSKGLLCDVCINLNFYPEVLYESNAVKVCCPKLHALLSVWRGFIEQDATRKYCLNHPASDFNVYVLSLLNGKNCLSVGDVGGHLQISKEHYKLHLYCKKEVNTVLSSFGLENKKFITLQRGATPSSQSPHSPKVWPLVSYNELVRLLKLQYPDVLFVQLGEKEEACNSIEGIDINLLGRTDWEDLKILLQTAWLHIDGECGLVHFRKAMNGGPSVVMFGPTPLEFYGYNGNINIRSEACEHWCARLTDTWLDRCPKQNGTAPCMELLTPANVASRILAWDRLEHCRKGLPLSNSQTAIKRLCEEEGWKIDDAYVAAFLKQRNVYHYERKKVKLKDLAAIVMTESGFQWRPIKNTPAYYFLQDSVEGKKKYRAYISLLQEKYYDTVHSEQRYTKLASNLNLNGYNAKSPLLSTPDLKLLDGQHRAAWLLHQFAEDYEIELIIIYSLLDACDLFPFEAVEKNAKVILYGMGKTGQSYYRQLAYTKYCHVLYSVDKEFKNLSWRLENCFDPNKISQNKGAYDYIIIASNHVKNCADIYRSLLEMGIEENKIIQRFPIHMIKP